ncbi:MAG TPA: type 1 glutamine amidotransferase domain-containing protein [Candidatus Sulfotelmatobacter sp.]|nr:type 1 glutamine amidotransferase domain-containing protein [Candidatus Sulfotelmatobacter sp.]
MARVLMPLPDRDFDPTETGVPWLALAARGHQVVFATPSGRPGEADPRMVTGRGLGILAAFLRADRNGRAAYAAMSASEGWRHPLRYSDLRAEDFAAILLPGGHAKGMRPYLEAPLLQATVAGCFAQGKPVGAICHGVLLAARSKAASGRSVLHGRRTTALTRLMELGAWVLTAAYLGDYYRTYPETVESEVKAALASPGDFLSGPSGFTRDAPDKLEVGFTLRDGNYLSARWPGDAHRFARDFTAMVDAA